MKKSNPKISFVIPLFNKEAYIAHCIQSLQVQTLDEIEIIVVNDASTDGSMDVVNYFTENKKEPRLVVVDLKENVGRSEARNVGNRVARGGIIAVQDADDVSVKERAQNILAYFKKHPEVDVFWSSFRRVDQFLDPIEEIPAVEFDIARSIEKRKNYICHSTMAYKKKCTGTVKYHSHDVSDLGIDDWLFQLELYNAGYKFGCLDKPLVMYRELTSGVSKTRDEEAVKRVKEFHLKRLGLI